MLRTSTSQDARFCAAYLRRCIEQRTVAFDYTSNWVKDMAPIVMGAPLVERTELYDEQLRAAEFHKYCDTTEMYLLYIGMFTVEDEFIKPHSVYPHPPVEVSYIRVTRFGRLYVRLPGWLQVVTLFAVYKTVSFMGAWRRFKWIGSLIALVLGVTGWSKTHQLSGVLVMLSTLGGLLATWILSAITSYFGENDGLSDNDP